MATKLKITQVRSLVGTPPRHRRTMEAIGFHHHQETLTKDDTPQLRGMLHQVGYLLRVEDAAADAEASRASKAHRESVSAKRSAKASKAAPATKASGSKRASKSKKTTTKKTKSKVKKEK